MFGKKCRIHRTAVLGDGVVLGDHVIVGPHAVLTGPLTVGDRCWIGAGVVLGAPPEILGAEHPTRWSEPAPHRGIVIGPDTTIRELSTVHHGSERETTVGAGCFVMNRVAIEHDVRVGDRCVVSAGSTFAGHVTVGDDVTVGMHTVVHQHRVIGSGAVTGMGTVVVKDVPPYAKAFGNPVALRGANRIGMGRSGIADADIDAVDRLFAPGAPETTVPSALAPAFERWRALARKPLDFPGPA